MPTSSLDVLTGFDPPVAAASIERLRALGSAAPATPRLAASVVLLRDGTGGLEVYLLQRHARMPFAASMVVFPGGGVDRADPAAGDRVRACAVRETMEETGVRLDPADLLPWAHWITPVPEPRRYDTWFFVAAVPPGQEPVDCSGETDAADWTTPAAALDTYTTSLMPPTRSILLELASLPDLVAVRAAATGRDIVAVLPELVERDGRWSYRYGAAR